MTERCHITILDGTTLGVDCHAYGDEETGPDAPLHADTPRWRRGSSERKPRAQSVCCAPAQVG